MKDFLHYLLSNLVKHSEQISIEEVIENQNLTINFSVAENDMGLVIGKHGQTIAALRTLIRLRNQITREYQMVTLHLAELNPSATA